MFINDNELSSVGASVKVEADMGYSGAIGAQLMMAEGYQNDFALFGSLILADVKEHAMIKEGAEEEAVYAMQEGALSSFWEKIKTFIKKIIAKVKGIFRGFVAKLEAWMGRDGRAFFDKYKREIFGKDVSGLKVRYSAPKADVAAVTVSIESVDTQGNIKDGAEHSELVEEYLGKMTPVKASAKEFRKEFHEHYFAEEEKDYEVKDVATMVQYISGKKNPIEAVKKMADGQEKKLNMFIKQVDKFENEAIKHAVDTKGDNSTRDYENNVGRRVGSEDNGSSKSLTSATTQKRAASYHRQISALQEALSIANGAALTEIKFAVAQSRRVAAAIVAYRGKKHEDTDLLELTQESAEYGFYSEVE